MSATPETRALPRPAAVPRLDAKAIGNVLLVAGICTIPVLLYLPFMLEPFARDEAFYAVAARDMLDGAVPYRDFLDNKPPLIFVWYAASFLLFGENLWAPRLLVSLMISLATLCVYFNGRLLFSSHNKAMLGATAFALSVGLAEFETNANAEYYMLFPMAAGLLAFTLAEKTGKDWWYLVAGVAGGATILTKTIYVIPMAFLFALAAWRGRHDPTPRPGWLSPAVWRGPLYMVAGSLAMLAMFAAPLLAAGAFDDMVEALTYYSLIYSEHVSLPMRLSFAATSPLYFLLLAGPWVIVSLMGAFVLLRGENRRDGVLLFGWFAANMLSIFAVGRYYDHYYAVMLPAMGLLIPPGAALVARNWRKIPAQVFIVVVLPLSLMTPLALTLDIYVQPDPETRHLVKFNGDEAVARSTWENQAPALGEWLKTRTDEDDRIWDFGFQPGIYFAAERRSPVRFYFDHAFGLDEDYEQEAIAALSASPPLYIADSATYEAETPLNYYSEPIHDWIEENYQYIGKVYFADIWKLKGAGE